MPTIDIWIFSVITALLAYGLSEGAGLFLNKAENFVSRPWHPKDQAFGSRLTLLGLCCFGIIAKIVDLGGTLSIPPFFDVFPEVTINNASHIFVYSLLFFSLWFICIYILFSTKEDAKNIKWRKVIINIIGVAGLIFVLVLFQSVSFNP